MAETTKTLLSHSSRRFAVLLVILAAVSLYSFGLANRSAHLPPLEISLASTPPRGQEISAEQRQRFVNAFGVKFAAKYTGAVVVGEGMETRILRIQWAGVDRPFAASIIRVDQIISDLRDIGFKHMILTDGNKSNWDIDLKN